MDRLTFLRVGLEDGGLDGLEGGELLTGRLEESEDRLVFGFDWTLYLLLILAVAASSAGLGKLPAAGVETKTKRNGKVEKILCQILQQDGL